MTPSQLQARAKNYRSRWLTVMGFAAQAPNEERRADGPRADDATLAHSLPPVTGADIQC